MSAIRNYREKLTRNWIMTIIMIMVIKIDEYSKMISSLVATICIKISDSSAKLLLPVLLKSRTFKWRFSRNKTTKTSMY
jgi:hypothetical protein